MKLQQYDIYLADLNFEDVEGHKIRPVMQINQDLYLPLVAKITSHSPRRNYGFEYAIQDWEEAGLSKPSTIRFSKTFRIKKSDLIKKIGHLSNFDIMQIEENNNDILENYYLNKKAGNVEANIQAFNNATFTGGLMEADSELSTFYYWGPIYLHVTGELWSDEEYAETRAVTRERALCNIKHKFFRKYGRTFNLKDSYLYEEPTIDYASFENPKEDHVEDPKYNFDDIDREGHYEVESSSKLTTNAEVEEQDELMEFTINNKKSIEQVFESDLLKEQKNVHKWRIKPTFSSYYDGKGPLIVPKEIYDDWD